MKLKLKLQDKQLEAAGYWLDDTTEELLYGGAKGGAKSYLGCGLTLSDALTYPETHYFIARHDLTDLKKFTTPSLYEVARNMGIDPLKYLKYNGQDNYFILPNGSRIFYLDCKYLPSDPDFHRFGSLQFTRGWAEEIGQIHSMAIINLAATVGRWKNTVYNLKRKMLFTCNPNKGFAFNEFYLPNKTNQLEPYRQFIKALPTDNKYLTQDYLDALDRMPENERQRLRYGNWEYDDDPATMIPYQSIRDMFTNTFVDPKNEQTKYIIADIARFGSDKAIVTVWSGLKLIDYHVFDLSATTDIQDIIEVFRQKYNVHLSNILVDEDGVGGGVKDNMHCKGFVNNSKPVNKAYNNLKSECGYKLAEMAGNIHIDIDLPYKMKEGLEQELGTLKTYRTDKDGKLQILPKIKIKELIGHSPDWLDIFIMRMFYFVKPSGSYAVR